ncbi:hypothetical protein, partial [Nocardia sp. NPDC004750]
GTLRDTASAWGTSFQRGAILTGQESTKPRAVPILTSVAIVIAVCSVAVNSVVRTEAFARLAMVATVLVAIFAIATAIYLNSMGDDLTRVVSYGTARDPGTQVGLLIRWARGHDNYPAPGFRKVSYATYSLTWSAIVAVGISLLSAMAAIAQWIRGRNSGLCPKSLQDQAIR